MAPAAPGTVLSLNGATFQFVQSHNGQSGVWLNVISHRSTASGRAAEVQHQLVHAGNWVAGVPGFTAPAPFDTADFPAGLAARTATLVAAGTLGGITINDQSGAIEPAVLLDRPAAAAP